LNFFNTNMWSLLVKSLVLWLGALLAFLLASGHAQDVAPKKITPQPMSSEKVAQFMGGATHTNNWAVLVWLFQFPVQFISSESAYSSTDGHFMFIYRIV
jgi:hypothetical protein